MIKKKVATSPPQKMTFKDNYNSPRNAPQQVIASDTSIGQNQDEDTYHRQTAKFYSPEYREEVKNSWQKSKSPQNLKSISQRGGESKNVISAAQRQALLELQKAKQNKATKSISERGRVGSKDQPWKSNPNQGNTLNIKPAFTLTEEEVYNPIEEAQQERQTFYPKAQTETAEFEYVFPNGDRYNGTWNGKWIEGSGVYDFTQQNLQYRGEFKGSKQHGRGTLLRKPTGHMQRQDIIYEGEWMNGYKEGFGKYYYFKDTFYEGSWIKNAKEGNGTFKSPEGEYVGEWKNDKKHGKGDLKLTNGTLLEGIWQFDEFASGTVTYSNGDKYDGELTHHSRSGFGNYFYANSQTNYRGRWQNNEKSGSGIIHYYNGDKYQGGMIQNKRDGPVCEYQWQSTGDKITGQFVNDLPVKGKINIRGEGQFQFNLIK